MGERFRRVQFAVRDGVMAGLAFGDQSRPIDLVFVHATGFNARTYSRLLAPLGERFHVVALDMRGHGLTRMPERLLSYVSWNRHRDDLIAMLDAYARAPVTLAGHSMGGTVGLLTAGKRPDLVRSAALIDPVIFPEARYRMFEAPFATRLLLGGGLARGAARRRAHFASREEARAHLHGKGIFKRFPDDVLDDYVQDGFVESEDGGVRLSCTPRFEAATFRAQRHDPWAALARYRFPLIVLRAEVGSTCPGNVANRMKDVRPDARIAMVEGSTHALPMERPDRVRAGIEAAIVMAQSGARFRDLD